jgi:hypothetical protein
MSALDEQISFTRRQAAAATGISYDDISAAVRSGDLREIHPEINGRKRQRGVILREDLESWLKEGL